MDLSKFTGILNSTMPHLRNRHIEPLIKQALQYSSITGIIGHRQTGKTTLLEKYSKSYTTLDDADSLEAANLNAKDFIERDFIPPLAIDECQLSPPIFPVLKEFVRTKKAKGQFLLSGSVRFTSRKAIAESLTGRILNLELLPMTISEMIHGKGTLKISETLKKLMIIPYHQSLLNETFENPQKKVISQFFSNYLSKGGLPGICFTRNQTLLKSMFKTHIETVLNRDLRLITQTTLPFRSLLDLAKALARMQGLTLDWTKLRMETAIGTLTLKKLVSAFESLFLIRIVSSYGGQTKPIIFFEDQGLARYLNDQEYLAPVDLIRGLYANLREQWIYNPDFSAEIFQYRTRSGSIVPLCLKWEGKILGILPTLERSVSANHIKTLSAFLKTFPQAQTLVAYSGDEKAKIISKNIAALPWTCLF